MKYATIKDAASAWVESFNAIQRSMIATLMDYSIEAWNEVTTPTLGDRVYIISGKHSNEVGKITEVCFEDEETIFNIELDSGTKIHLKQSDNAFKVERDSYLPMWGTIWSFRNPVDNWWLENNNNGIEIMSECGFRIFEHEEWGYFFGIDGCGYSFYDEHWIPLYKKRGLHWHNPKTEQEYQMQSKGYQKKSHGNTECWYDGDKFIEEVIK